jgi:hypothetical protein
MKTLVLYVFNELNKNVSSFITNSIFLDHDIDFVVINNGCHNEPVLPDYVIYFKSDKIGSDFLAWSRGILYNELYKDYDNFIFLNSDASGPYLPSYFQGRWTDIYLNGLTDTIRLFGSTISTESDPESLSHVQAYVFAMNKATLEFLITKQIFSMTDTLKDSKEIKMSRFVLENGWNIGCLMRYYNGVDFRFLASNPSDYKPFLGNPLVSKNFSNRIFNNFYEFVFIKSSQFDFNLSGLVL